MLCGSNDIWQRLPYRYAIDTLLSFVFIIAYLAAFVSANTIYTGKKMDLCNYDTGSEGMDFYTELK